MARDLLASRELSARLLVRNLSARYRQTLLGYFWAVFPPLATTGVWLFLTRQKVVHVDSGQVPYPVFLVTGTILWQTFVDAIQIPIRVISESRQMLAKINFPRESLVITAAGECVFNFLIRLFILASADLYLGFVPVTSWPLAFTGVAAIMALGMAIGLMLSPFALLYQDITHGLVFITQIWMYATPVIYAAKTTGTISLINTINPVSPVLTQTRDWILTGHTTHLFASTVVFGITLIALAVGFVLYRIALPRAIERLSS